MKSYLLKRTSRQRKIVSFDYDITGYTFKPNSKAKEEFLNVNKINIINPQLIDAILTIKFNKKYRRLVMIALSVIQENDDETTNGDIMLALNEIARLRAIITDKYQKFLKKEKEEKFIKQLRILENELRSKQIEIKMNMLNNFAYEEEERHFGR